MAGEANPVLFVKGRLRKLFWEEEAPVFVLIARDERFRPF